MEFVISLKSCLLANFQEYTENIFGIYSKVHAPYKELIKTKVVKVYCWGTKHLFL